MYIELELYKVSTDLQQGAVGAVNVVQSGMVRFDLTNCSYLNVPDHAQWT